MVTDAAGEEMTWITYTPYGDIDQDHSAGWDRITHKYTGHELDAETGLYYMKSRYYDPKLARFLTPDSIIPNIANAQSFNRYSYVEGNPIMYTDPTGHKKCGGNIFNRFACERQKDSKSFKNDAHKFGSTGAAFKNALQNVEAAGNAGSRNPYLTVTALAIVGTLACAGVYCAMAAAGTAGYLDAKYSGASDSDAATVGVIYAGATYAGYRAGNYVAPGNTYGQVVTRGAVRGAVTSGTQELGYSYWSGSRDPWGNAGRAALIGGVQGGVGAHFSSQSVLSEAIGTEYADKTFAVIDATKSYFWANGPTSEFWYALGIMVTLDVGVEYNRGENADPLNQKYYDARNREDRRWTGL